LVAAVVEELPKAEPCKPIDVRCLAFVLQSVAEYQQLVLIEYLLAEQLINLAVRVHNQQCWPTVCEDHVVKVAPLDVEQQFGLVKFL